MSTFWIAGELVPRKKAPQRSRVMLTYGEVLKHIREILWLKEGAKQLDPEKEWTTVTVVEIAIALIDQGLGPEDPYPNP
jgi:hypothetical protein